MTPFSFDVDPNIGIGKIEIWVLKKVAKKVVMSLDWRNNTTEQKMATEEFEQNIFLQN